MFFRQWDVLLVDDEPDVLQISKLAMKNFDVYGVPLKLHTTASKAETIEYLIDETGLSSTLAVAFIDVVMETDNAGLELCKYIRDELKNKRTQLFIRTGQPGIAPERKVIDDYDINGYFTKAEATEDKLYSLVKSGVRQFVWTRAGIIMLLALDSLITAGDSQDKMIATVRNVFHRFVESSGEEEPEAQDLWYAIGIEDQLIDRYNMDESTALELKHQLEQREGTPLGPHGNTHVRGEDNLQLLKIAPHPFQVETFFLFQTSFVTPEIILVMLHSFFKALATLWVRAS
jgi:CheY-like chemotaxis protein